MCNTTCNNHSHEEYNVDYIENEQTLDITTEDVPCSHEQNIYIVQDTEDNDQCDCNKCSKCEPKKVSCRSLACQQLNDECSCKRKKKKIRKTTMVNVLENNVLRLEDKMNSGCADMHESIEDLENNINLVYNELKDEEARAKKQEAFLHYGLDDAVTRAEYNPEDRKIYFYHKNPQNCLNVNVHEGCDCDCCNACGCECKCNTDECSSDIPYTMDDECNIVPMTRDEEKLPFEIDCRDFLRDIFISNAYLEDSYPDDFDGEKDGPFLIIEYRRYLEKDLEVDPDQTETPDQLRIDLSKVWKLQNYYDKAGTRDEIKKLRIINTYNQINPNNPTTIANLYYRDEGLNGGEGGDVLIGAIEVKMKPIDFPEFPDCLVKAEVSNDGGTLTITDSNGGTTVFEGGGSDEPVNNVAIQNATLQWGQAVPYGTMNGTQVSITLPQAPAAPQGGISFAVTDVDYIPETNQLKITYSQGDPKYIQLPSNSGGECLWEAYSDGIAPKNSKKVYGPGFYDTTVN